MLAPCEDEVVIADACEPTASSAERWGWIEAVVDFGRGSAAQNPTPASAPTNPAR
mgnify:CR=1 FL=1